MDTQKQLIRLKESTGLSLKDFAAYFDIPYRTMQDWYYGKRKMPDYLLRLINTFPIYRTIGSPYNLA